MREPVLPTPEEVSAAKARLRRELLARRRDVSSAQRQQAETQALAHLLAWPVFAQAPAVHCYLARPEELPTQGVMQACFAQGKTVYVPMLEAEGQLGISRLKPTDTLVPGPWDIPQQETPHPVAQVDWAAALSHGLVLVPGLAFDDRGGRLGYGKGYYDRFLGRLRQQFTMLGTTYEPLRVGWAYDWAIHKDLPQDPWDIPLKALVTPAGILLTNPS